MYNPVDFKIINESFEKRFPELNVFQGALFNYVKLAQHASSFDLTNATDKLLPQARFMPWWKYQTRQIVKSFLSKKQLPTIAKAATIVVEGPRVLDTPQGKMGAITGGLTKFEFSWWDVRGAIGNEADLSIDLAGDYYFPLEDGCKLMYNDLKQVMKRARAAFAHLPNFLVYFESSLLVFFESYRKWNYLLRKAQPTKLYFICHYHNEGIIAVCKQLGIEVVELQHGLISKKDIYYVYPDRFKSVYSNALFPDRLWVYGSFWKQLFSDSAEWTSGKIEIVGDFRYETRLPNLQLRENAILLCSQKNLHEPYLAYIQFLKLHVLPKHPDWKLLVKMHPLERMSEAYFSESTDQVEVLPLQSNMGEALSRCKIQVSIYSTTFFDALGFSVANYALTDTGYSSDYVAEIIEQRIALALLKEEDPIAKFLSEGLTDTLISAEEVYAPLKIQGLS